MGSCQSTPASISVQPEVAPVRRKSIGLASGKVDPNKAAGRKRRLSIVGTENRRQSILAESVQNQIRSCQGDSKIETLFVFLKKEMVIPPERADVEFCSWGLSAMGELVSGNEVNRKKCMELGAKKIIITLMESFPNDVYVQWQGCMAIAQLSATAKYAAEFGEEALTLVLDCIGRTDVCDIGATGCRTIRNLVQVDENMQKAKDMGTVQILKDLLAQFKTNGDPQFIYRGNNLIVEMEAWSASSSKDEAQDLLPPWLSNKKPSQSDADTASTSSSAVN